MKQSPLILIVDDIEYNIILLNEILLNSGYRVLSAMNGKNCLEILNTDTPDIILLDVIMPEMNGYDIADLVKSNEKTKNIPIIFLSAISDYESKLKGLEKGAVDYITKPYDEKEVIARIQIHLKIKELEKERDEHILKLEALNKDKDNLLQIIAHDMRSPLTSIMLMSEFLMSYQKEINLEKLNKYSNTIFNSSKKILQLINQLLRTSKIESSKNEINSFDLVAAVKHAVDLVNRLLEKKSVLLTYQFFEPKILVNLDEGKFDQVLNNILYNAIKFTNQNGSIKINVQIKIENDSKILHVSIQDNGIGMPANIREEIFSKEKNHHRDGTQGEEGTGIGLLITKNLMLSLNAQIEIESEEGAGTTVHLYFYKY